jgi:hypothetical protein
LSPTSRNTALFAATSRYGDRVPSISQVRNSSLIEFVLKSVLGLTIPPPPLPRGDQVIE